MVHSQLRSDTFGVAAIFPYRRHGRERPGTGKNLCETRKWNSQFHRKISNGKTGLPFQKFHFFPEIFQRNEPKNHVPFTSQPEFSEFLGNWKTPKNSLRFSKMFQVLLQYFKYRFPSFYVDEPPSCYQDLLDRVKKPFLQGVFDQQIVISY